MDIEDLINAVPLRSSWGTERLYATLVALQHHSTDEVLTLVGVLIVLGCLVAAGVAAWRALWVASGCLLVVAMVAAYLLF